MKNLYEVTAVKGNYVVHKSYQTAESEKEAIDTVKTYYLRKAKGVFIRAEFVRKA